MNLRFSPPVTGIVAGVKSLFGIKPKDDDDVAGVIDTDSDGNQLFKEDIIREVLEKLEERRIERNPLEIQWTLNANFLVGNQYCDFNIHREEIEQLEPVYDWLERESFNKIAPLIETRVANLKKINHMMKVKPRTNELEDYDKASVSTNILQYAQKASDFETKKNTAIYWNEVCGNCFWMSWWDKMKGDKVAVDKTIVIDDKGNEKVNEEVYYSGDIDYGLISPYEIFPESIFKQSIEAQRSIIVEQVKSVEDIYDLYGIEVEGTSIETFQLTPLSSGGGFGYENAVMGLGHKAIEGAQKVVTYFERASRRYPNGRMIIIVGDTELVYYGDLPYKNIPIVQMVAKEIPGQFFGKSVIEGMIPIQRAYNGVLNRIHEFAKRTVLGNIAVEEGSIDIEVYEQDGLAPGAMLVYRDGFNPPTPIPNGNLPSELMQERYNLISDMEYAAGVSQLMVTGNAPQTNMSGAALTNLMEIDNTRLSLTGDHIRNSIRKLAICWLEIYKKYATTKRVIDYVGTNDIGKALVWSNEDINSYDVEYVSENELLMSEEVQKQNFFNAYNMGLFTDSDGRIPERVKQKALEYMKVGNYSEMMNMNALQIQAAQRENVFFENGVIPEVSEFDEHTIHEEEHLRYILQMDFRLLKMKKPDYAAALEDHLRAHKQAIAQEEQQKAMQAMGMQMNM